MKRPYKFVICITAFFLLWGNWGCRKADKPGPDQPTPLYAKMNGRWTATGESSDPNGRYITAFDRFDVEVINDTTIFVGKARVYYDTVASNKNIAVFKNQWYSPQRNTAELRFDPTTGVINFAYSSDVSMGRMEFMLSTTSFHSNPHIADYSAKIPGVKTLAGYVYDTLSYGDSVSQFSVDDIEIKFTQVDDSTLHFNINVDDRNFLKISDDEDMYYKSTDLVAQTVTFQTPNLYSIYFTTLTYNYLTGSIVFEHYRKIGNTSVHIKLQ